jgi:hypothetical protein
MNNRSFVKGEKHHWWPQAVSKYWCDDTGNINVAKSSGEPFKAKPKNVARIADAHNLTFNRPTVWDSTYENLFDAPDNNFPGIITKLKAISDEHLSLLTDEQSLVGWRDLSINLFVECAVSIILRSPRFRNQIAPQIVESDDSKKLKKQREQFVSSNLHQCYQTIQNDIRDSGRLTVLITRGEEFIFGDGMYNNFSTVKNFGGERKFFLPITPQIALIWYSPRQYRPEPKVTSYILSKNELETLNTSTQIYAKEFLYYRKAKLRLTHHFKEAQFLQYCRNSDPVDTFIKTLNTTAEQCYLIVQQLPLSKEP